MTKADLADLRSSMQNVKVRKKNMRQQSFVALVLKRDKSFGESQINQAFGMIDTDGTGKIEKEEYREFDQQRQCRAGADLRLQHPLLPHGCDRRGQRARGIPDEPRATVALH